MSVTELAKKINPNVLDLSKNPNNLANKKI